MDKGAGFTPRLDILPPLQRRLWDELADVPPQFVFYGGTAIALHLGHRQSLDFDFFGNRRFDSAKLVSEVPFMANAQITQREPTGLVQVSFFGVPELPRLATPHQAPDNRLRVASLLDLAGMQASVVQVRAEAKDYIDIDALMTQGGIDLPTVLAAGRAIYGRQFNPQITLKALSFFDDGDLRQLPAACKERLATAACEVDLERLPDIGVRALVAQCDRKLEP
jgi:hypothetical protein